MKVISLLVLLFAASAAGRAAAEPDAFGWNHARLTSADSTDVAVDFQVAFSHLGAFATPVWVNVHNAQFQGTETVRVTLQDLARYYDPSAHGGMTTGPIDPAQVIVLAYAGDGRFTGRLPNSVDLNGSHDGLPCQSLAVQINDWWLTDPISNGSSFQLDLDAAAGLEFR